MGKVKHEDVRNVLFENYGQVVTLTYKRSAGKTSTYDIIISRIRSSSICAEWPEKRVGKINFFNCVIKGIKKIEKDGVVLFQSKE